MSQIYYIDGYNVIHLSPEMQGAMHEDIERARELLIERVTKWVSATQDVAKIIFDGQGQRTEESPHHSNSGPVEILFSSKHKTADQIIERAVYQSNRKGGVIVVSADRGITDLCMGMGALVMHPTNFLSQVGEASSEISRAVKRRKSGPLGRLEERFDGDTLDHLEDLKRRLEKRD